MGIAELVLIGVGLSMDAFAVAVCKGLGMRRLNLKVALVLALFFGGFQALMPTLGYLLGDQFLWLIEPIDHWVAFGLLALVGGKMFWDAAFDRDDDNDLSGALDANTINLGEYLVLAVGTSIDALAVGISFAALSVDILPSAGLIGCITFCLTIVGVAVGHFFGARWERPASITGGLVLILIGLKILLEHLGFIAF